MSKAGVHIQSDFGSCPRKELGPFSLDLIKHFDQKGSLYDLEQKTLEQTAWKDYLTFYRFRYHPFHKTLHLKFDCAKPVLALQIYEQKRSHKAIIAENGKILDWSYLKAFYREHSLENNLPLGAIARSFLDQKNLKRLLGFYDALILGKEFKLSELIVDSEGDLTVVLSSKNGPSTLFIGSKSWESKVLKLNKIIEYFSSLEKFPQKLNLRDSKKIVVKLAEGL